ncbi:hypothetical protein CLAFUW4_09103 [Fulvia fulva]|uniref:Chromo domain-containing protein n=1 Tax=Passalora fulva TaxID=5499 RepID=A0A9Q8PGG5_PASFU|nr:uncharacterized protein CLAFUR5_09214 [Fulvia fulva]KAK4613707.1 hypothetical protein CLAFUR4_09109 [Fulvia fulva]KAK4614839.1 hypothetical protein CLAFUR0_09101 [Fulvia fulva]UJO22056.1 hypothetical protein CLAFUR5_09214 [Fulvia fulva]WPV20346.1 hypothetical protein CLAFUW4_09103 [Fulvia fulva]WPV35295.1 hypothetical protein CLAFUW7_09104 [Fulvia fulva]
MKKVGTKVKYLVKWQDLGPIYNEWVDESELLENCSDIVQEYHDGLLKTVNPEQKEPRVKQSLPVSHAPLTKPRLTLHNPQHDPTQPQPARVDNDNHLHPVPPDQAAQRQPNHHHSHE